MKSIGHYFCPTLLWRSCMRMPCWHFTWPLWVGLELGVVLKIWIPKTLYIIHNWHDRHKRSKLRFWNIAAMQCNAMQCKHTYRHSQATDMKLLWKQLNKFWVLDKFRDENGNCKEHNLRVEEDIPKTAVSYTVQEDETERGKLRVECYSIKNVFVDFIMSYC